MPPTAWKKAALLPELELHVEGLGPRTATRIGAGHQRDVFRLSELFPEYPDSLVAKVEIHPPGLGNPGHIAEARAYGWREGYHSNADEVLWMGNMSSTSLRPRAPPGVHWAWCGNRYGARVPLSVLLVELFPEDLMATLMHHLAQGDRAEGCWLVRAALEAPLAMVSQYGVLISDLFLSNLGWSPRAGRVMVLAFGCGKPAAVRDVRRGVNRLASDINQALTPFGFRFLKGVCQ